MKATIELRGQVYESRTALCQRFGVSIATIQRWRERGLLPMPTVIGKIKFYRLDEVEARLATPATTQ
jgi:DNA-binding transcriptional MerR regulator